ncbi:MAG TPA: ParA family protein [Vicinamibacteria bacterium]|jgi:chromosome partitioning protein
MTRIVAIANQKGGVGKTTTAINVSTSVAAAEKRALVVDMDPQANLTSGLGIDPTELSGTIYAGLVEGMGADELIRDTELPTLKLIPSERNLTGAEIELVDQPRREFRLREFLAPIASSYDFIFIDCPPSLGLLTLNALVAADSVLIPLQCEFFALAGVSELLSTVSRVRASFNPKLEIEGIVFTMVDERTNLTTQVMDDVRQNFPGIVYRSIIPRNIRLAEAPSFGKPILLYDVRSRGAEAYLSLTKEILGHEAQGAR